MPATIQFVDSISASPTVRLDVNDAVSWFCGNFSAPPPRLRRSESGNSMGDGGIVSSSSYENRTIELELTLLNTSTEDAAAAELQKLWRELDRPMNYLRYQREGATKPVFFRVFRSDSSDLEELWTAPTARKITVELLAEPFALGLPETLGPYTVTNDPAAASNGCFFDVTGVIGDVASPAVVHDGTRTVGHGILATRTRGPLVDLLWNKQLESGSNVTLGADTTNPGGGPDSAMSGTGTNNYVRTSFATNAAMVTRVTWLMFNEALTANQRRAIRGTYRLIVVVRRSDSTSVINIGTTSGPSVSTSLSTSRQMVDLGFATIGERTGARIGYGAEVAGSYAPNLPILAQRVSGSGTLDWDAVILVPADEQQMQWTVNSDVGTTWGTVIDGVQDSVGLLNTATPPLSGNPYLWSVPRVQASGAFPMVTPGVTNRFFFLQAASKGGAMTKSDTSAMTVYYWPRYLFVRPVSS